jgi:hypothetical protein
VTWYSGSPTLNFWTGPNCSSLSLYDGVILGPGGYTNTLHVTSPTNFYVEVIGGGSIHEVCDVLLS